MAAKTLKNLLVLVNIKGGSLFIVEGAKADVVLTALSELDIAHYNLEDIGARTNLADESTIEFHPFILVIKY